MPTSLHLHNPRAHRHDEFPPPQPHLPLREASAQRLRSRQQGPRPYFAPSRADQQLRGFKPVPVQPQPHIDNVNASSEHAFAGRDTRRPSKLPLDVSLFRTAEETNVNRGYARPSVYARSEHYSRSPSPSPLSPARGRTSNGLRNAKSLGDSIHTKYYPPASPADPMPSDGTSTARSSLSRPSYRGEGPRASFRSATTTVSSLLHTDGFGTNRSSQATSHTSPSVLHSRAEPEIDHCDGDMSVEDAIGMYEGGFESSQSSLNEPDDEMANRPASQPQTQPEKAHRPVSMHRRSQSASLLHQWKTFNPPDLPASVKAPVVSNADHITTVTPTPRDRYGFKKASLHITVEQYDIWDATYSDHLERRRRKWESLMRSFGLSTSDPIRFPPKNDKIKRYVRKGIPPELRGAAWFWYAGGPGKLAKEPGLYRHLLQQVKAGELTENDKEHIERDLNRTFPDNIKFKPDAPATDEPSDERSRKARASQEIEPSIVQALRRVLQAFAVHNPNVGYCQSLNFIAGLLLLFLHEDEEKAFVLLNVITTEHLPGTHGIALEGANIDIAVLMSCIKDSLPAVWAKLDDKGGGLMTGPTTQTLRLPTVSLATTAWFMSLFVGTLPIECVLRVWDCLFFEGSKTLFRIAVAIFKAGERQIVSIHDPMEIFQVVQTIPRAMLDINGLMEVCFRRRGGFAHISQGMIEHRRQERRTAVRNDVALIEGDRGRGAWTKRWRSRTKV